MIQRYVKNNKEDVMELFRLNAPTYFDVSEEKDLNYYLDHEFEDYFVVVKDTKIVGAGGVNYENDETVGILSWDFIHPEFHGKGIGSELTKYRIKHIKKNDKVKLIKVRTSQLTYPFYEKMGFKTQEITKDYWAKGFDLYLMELEILK